MKLFTKTYRGDFEWLGMAIKTVQKFCRDEVEWTIVCEDGERSQLSVHDSDRMKFKIHQVSEHWPEAMQIQQGYIRQQWVKLNAHKVIGNDLFMNWDSDVIAVRPFSVENFKGKSNRPIQWFGAYNEMILSGADPSSVKAYQLRRELAGLIFGWPISFEWMRCLPTPGFGEILRCGAGTRYWKHMFELCKSRPEAFSEFNFIGEFSHKFFPDAYEWRNSDNAGPTWSTNNIPKDAEKLEFQAHTIVCQGWSHGGIPDVLRKWVDAQ